MKTAWSTSVNYSDHCKFYEFNSLIYFPCNSIKINNKNFISVFCFYEAGRFSNERFFYEPYNLVARGQDWRVFIENKKLIISCGRDHDVVFYTDQNGLHREEKDKEDLFLDITEKIIRIKPSVSMLRDYKCDSTVIHEEESVSYGDYEFRLYGNCGYQCIDKKSGRVLWKNKHQGYRYTDFEIKDDKVFFGTAGFGGKLYCYDLYSGEIICNINTHGTSAYIWHNNNIFCRDEKGNLILVDPYENKIVECFKMRGQIPYHSVFTIIDDYLYTLTSETETGLKFVNCIDLK